MAREDPNLVEESFSIFGNDEHVYYTVINDVRFKASLVNDTEHIVFVLDALNAHIKVIKQSAITVNAGHERLELRLPGQNLHVIVDKDEEDWWVDKVFGPSPEVHNLCAEILEVIGEMGLGVDLP